jgi:HD-GYP domain-containing protein (c-di-GMP phosphodiesterase class II)
VRDRQGGTPRWLLALLALWATGPIAVLHYIGGQEVQVASVLHFGLVAFAATVAAGASIGLTIAGARAQDGRTLLIGMAFSTMTALLAIHGLATPGFIAGPNGVIALTGAASLPAGGAVLALSALPSMRHPQRVRPLLVLQGVLAVGIVALGTLGLLFPTLVPSVPQVRSPGAIALLVIGLSFFGVLALRGVRTFTLTRRTTDLLVTVGCLWLGTALVPQLLLGYGTLGFYIGHGMEIVGVILVGVPAALDLRQGGPSRPLVGDLTASQIVADQEAYLGPRVRALMLDLAAKDRSTEEHTRRVALLAAAVGEELRLPAATQRHLAIGGLLHDMGKLRVPQAILSKPGPLDDEEFNSIKRHPDHGSRLLTDLGGFAPEVVSLVLDHHERLDGSGYPRGLRGDEIGIATRVLSVCDVYDALVSDRVYRPARPRESALALLRRESGTAFDAECVAVLERVLGRQDPDPGWVAGLAPARVGLMASFLPGQLVTVRQDGASIDGIVYDTPHIPKVVVAVLDDEGEAEFRTVHFKNLTARGQRSDGDEALRALITATPAATGHGGPSDGKRSLRSGHTAAPPHRATGR